jgi:ribose/xylose/arabinose/galactoside ABC-type transport system permease subunit
MAVPTQKTDKVSFPTKSWFNFNFLLGVLPYVVLIIIAIVLGIITPHFGTFRNLTNVLEQSSTLAIMAIGMTCVLIVGGIDLSAPAIMAFSAVLGVIFLRATSGTVNPATQAVIGAAAISSPVLRAILTAAVMLVAGMAAGAINGFAVSYLKMVPFVVTLAMQFICLGAATWLTQSVGIQIDYNLNSFFVDMTQKRFDYIPIDILYAVIIVFIAYLLMHKSYLGRWLYAAGTNAKTTRISGIPTQKVIMSAYIVSGLTAGIAAIITSARLLSASSLIDGENAVLDIISSAVVGGVSIYGGSGSPLGAALGAILIGLISNAMNMLRVSYDLTLMIKGLFILAFIYVYSLRKK